MTLNVEVSFPGGKRVDAYVHSTDSIGDALVKTDQSESAGGEGSAPEPFQLFLASIATCAGVNALNFCQARNLSTEDLSLEMQCERAEDDKGYSKMRLVLGLPVDFPEKYKKAILSAINLCAVKRHITKPPEFETMLK